MKEIKYKNVPKDVVQNAVDWHNGLTGDNWDLTAEEHPDIQHRIRMIAEKLTTGCYLIKDDATFVVL